MSYQICPKCKRECVTVFEVVEDQYECGECVVDELTDVNAQNENLTGLLSDALAHTPASYREPIMKALKARLEAVKKSRH